MKLRPVEPETEVDAGQWIRPRLLEWWSLPDHRMPVGATVPTGFKDYVRVFHPPYRTSGEMDRPVRWSEIASLAGVSLAADTAWDDLQLDLEHCQQNPNALRRSRETVRGWLDYMGPCFHPADIDATANKIRGIVQQCGFAEPPSRKAIREWWRRAWRRWRTIQSNLGGEDDQPRGD